MKAIELVNNGTLTLEDLMNFVDGTENYEQVQKELNESTGFESTKLCSTSKQSLTIFCTLANFFTN